MIEPDVKVLASERYAELAADVVQEAIAGALQARGACRIGLAGGGTPKPIYEALGKRDDIDWGRVTIFFGDERAVGPEDESSNFRMAKRAFGASFEQASVERIEGERPPEEARADYERRLGEQPLDVLLLGMGPDGHTASLFPGQAIGEGRVVLGTSPVPPTSRISLSPQAINESGVVMLLVCGGAKAGRLAEVYGQLDSDTPSLPAARVRPQSGRLVWLVDSAAAANLPQKDNR